MPEYDFKSLNSQDFELLVRDLLNAELAKSGSIQYYSSFTAGKDRGIDLLDSDSHGQEYNCIVQVKHYINTPYSTLLNHLVKTTSTHRSEIEKIKKLVPNRLIIATSKSLTLANREEIVDKMRPYVRSIRDVIDQQELNRLIGLHPEIEANHTKLWFSSRVVLERILHNDTYHRSKQLINAIQRKMRLFVPVQSLGNLINNIKKNRLLILTGAPGNGKTTIAEILLYQLLSEHNARAYWIDKSVIEIESQLNEDDNPQIFYFDDFLGHTKAEIESLKSEEKSLLYFVNEIKRLPNKYLILTTRTSILNEAIGASERLRRAGIIDKKYEVEVDSFTIDQKLKMIRNHLDVNEVSEQYSENLTEGNNLETIAMHRNFSPRLIEFVTTENNYQRVRPKDYFSFVVTQLNHPQEVWLHAYSEQLDDYDRFLLQTLYSFGGAISIPLLQESFEQRVQFEIAENHIPRKYDAFDKHFRKLMDSFLTIKIYQEENKIYFINPSLEDFLNHHLKENTTECVRIANGAKYVEQIISKFRPNGQGVITITLGTYFLRKIQSTCLDCAIPMKPEQKEAYISLYNGIITWLFFRNSAGAETASKYIKAIKWNNLAGHKFIHLLDFLHSAHNETLFIAPITNNFDEIIRKLLVYCTDLLHFQDIRNLFGEYGMNYNNFLEKQENAQTIFESIHSFFENEIDETVADLKGHALTVGEVDDAKEFLVQRISSSLDIFDVVDMPDLSPFDAENWDHICYENMIEAEMFSNNSRD